MYDAAALSTSYSGVNMDTQNFSTIDETQDLISDADKRELNQYSPALSSYHLSFTFLFQRQTSLHVCILLFWHLCRALVFHIIMEFH